MKLCCLFFLIALLLVNAYTLLSQTPDHIILSNGTKVDNIESAHCETFGEVQYCLITFTFGDTVLTVATSESYLAFDDMGGLLLIRQ